MLNTIILILFVNICGTALALTSSQVYTNARNAFSMGNFCEAEELFTRFCRLWPEHKLTDSAIRFKVISQARSIDKKIDNYRKELLANLEKEYIDIENNLSASAKSEVVMALDRGKGSDESFNWSYVNQLSNEDLLRVLTRGWHPSPYKQPIESLTFLNKKLTNEKDHLEPALESRLLLLKAHALWQVSLSPLPQHANSRILKVWNDWPVHKALNKTLNKGFNLSSDNLKREFALLGLHYDCFRHKGVASSVLSGLKSRWLDYLRERGITTGEAWCPR
jgi:hypothetical protein